jgi:hypothetical protein
MDMSKLKSPKVWGPVLGVIMAVIMAANADLKSVVVDICAAAGASQPAESPK